jgi:uncharacterized protein
MSGFARNPEGTVCTMKKIDALALMLVIVGALNWGLVALAEFDLVAAIAGLEFGETNAFTRVVYALVGLSGIYVAVQASAMRRRWSSRLVTA